MRELLFVDTSAWFAAVSKLETAHQAVKRTLQEARSDRRPLVTSDYVVDETLTLIRSRAGHRHAVTFGNGMWRRGAAEIVFIDETIIEQAWQTFVRFEEHDLSFTDCTSAALMRQRGLTEIVSLDRHFDILGFRRLPHA